MHRASRVWLGFAVLALAVQLCGSSALAQQAAPEQSPGPPATVVLPEEVPAGESATLAVLDSEGRMVPGAAVQLSTGVKATTDSTGRSLFLAPPQAGTMTAQLQNGSSFTTNVAGGTTPASGVWQEIDLGLGIPKGPPKGGPNIVALADRFYVRDTGHSDASRIKVTLGGEPALVLASSPVSMVVLPSPRTTVGKTELNIEVAGKSAIRLPIVVVSLAVTGPTTALAKGKKGVLQVTVSGTKDKLLVEVHNLSPDVVRFPKGDAVQLKTSGGMTNAAKIEVVGVNPGDYSVSARFVTASPVVLGAR
jgi:hypothetical protein